MKYNEPIRSKGIGRNQLAFPTGGKYSELLNDEDEFNAIAQDSTLHIAQEVTSQAIGLSRSSATAAASSAHKRAQNYPFGMSDITSFSVFGTNFYDIPFGRVNVINPNYFYDVRDRIIYVNEAGWYWVQVYFNSAAVTGTNTYALRIATNVANDGVTEDYEPIFAFQQTNQQPVLVGSTLVNLPNQVELVNRNGRYGFKVQLYSTATSATFTPSNSEASLHVFKLAELFEADRRFTIQV